jgi:hypothetical protein
VYSGCSLYKKEVRNERRNVKRGNRKKYNKVAKFVINQEKFTKRHTIKQKGQKESIFFQNTPKRTMTKSI